MCIIESRKTIVSAICDRLGYSEDDIEYYGKSRKIILKYAATQSVKSRTEELRRVESELRDVDIEAYYDRRCNGSTVGGVVVTVDDIEYTILVKAKDYHKISREVEEHLASVINNHTRSNTKPVNVVFCSDSKSVKYKGVHKVEMSGKPKTRKQIANSGDNEQFIKADVFMYDTDMNRISVSVKDEKGGYHYEVADTLYTDRMRSVFKNLESIHTSQCDYYAKFFDVDTVFDPSKVADIVDDENEHLIDFSKSVFGDDVLTSDGCLVASNFAYTAFNQNENTVIINCEYIFNSEVDITTDEHKPRLVYVVNKNRNKNGGVVKGRMPVVTTKKRASLTDISQTKRGRVLYTLCTKLEDFYQMHYSENVNTTAGMATYQSVLGKPFKRKQLNEYKRIEMPNINDHDSFEKDVTEKFDAYHTLMKKEDLNPTQSEFNQDKVASMVKSVIEGELALYSKSVIVAEHDDTAYIIDGHHRYATAMEIDEQPFLACLMIKCEPDALIEYLNKQDYVVNKSIKE